MFNLISHLKKLKLSSKLDTITQLKDLKCTYMCVNYIYTHTDNIKNWDSEQLEFSCIDNYAIGPLEKVFCLFVLYNRTKDRFKTKQIYYLTGF